MSIRCLLCNRAFSAVTHAHLKSVHGITTGAYRRMFPCAELVSTETKQQQSISISKAMTVEVRQKLSIAVSRAMTDSVRHKIAKTLTGHKISETTRHRISEANKGKVRSAELRQRLSDALTGNTNALGHRLTTDAKRRISEGNLGREIGEETRQQMSKSLLGNTNSLGRITSKETKQKLSTAVSKALRGHKVSDETKQRLSESNKARWKDPCFACRMTKAQQRRPNNAELRLQEILNNHFPGEWKYVGDGKFWIEGKNPDFVNINGKKQVIELFGAYWHDKSEVTPRITHFKKYGFNCLVLWECDIRDEAKVIRKAGKLK